MQVSLASPGCPAPVRKKLLYYPPREVAQELCLMDAELLRKIQPEELVHGAWMKKDKVCVQYYTADSLHAECVRGCTKNLMLLLAHSYMRTCLHGAR